MERFIPLQALRENSCYIGISILWEICFCRKKSGDILPVFPEVIQKKIWFPDFMEKHLPFTVARLLALCHMLREHRILPQSSAAHVRAAFEFCPIQHALILLTDRCLPEIPHPPYRGIAYTRAPMPDSLSIPFLPAAGCTPT